MKVTIKDIAKIAGVSHSTVSRSLNDHPRISKSTKDKIKKIAEDLDFEFNFYARSLNLKFKTNIIAIMLQETSSDLISGLYLNNGIRKIQINLEKKGIGTIIEFINYKNNKNEVIKRLIRKNRVDAFIIFANISKDDYKLIKEYKVPVIIGHFSGNELDLTSISTNHLSGGYQGIKFLLENGHNKILTLTHRKNEAEYKERLAGQKKAFSEFNINNEPKYMLIDTSFWSGYNLTKKNIKLIKQYDAIFSHNDLPALGVLKALYEENIKVPQDISVMGYDDIELGEYSIPSLTTIHQPMEKISEDICKEILEKLDDKNKENLFCKKLIKNEPRIVIRKSVQLKI